MSRLNDERFVQSATAVIARLHTPSSARSRALLKIHVRRAYIHVELCRATQQPVLDCCGEQGDLFFLLSFLHGLVGGDVTALEELLSNMVNAQNHEESTQQLTLSRRELATMAA